MVQSLVRYLPGVQGIENKLRVSAQPVNAILLRRAIAEALERRADREARHVQVVVEGGTVTLAGKVRTWMDKQAILGLVGHAPGIQAVRDQLEIDPLV
jgi:osmotically-inducible protein OsmY